MALCSCSLLFGFRFLVLGSLCINRVTDSYMLKEWGMEFSIWRNDGMFLPGVMD